MNNKYNKIIENDTKKLERELLKDEIFDNYIFNKISKFHQYTTFFRNNNIQSVFVGNNVYEWAKMSEYIDILPDVYEKSIQIEECDVEIIGSYRDFCQKKINFKDFSYIIQKTLSRNNTTKSRNYGSAGGLYPIVPIFCVLSSSAIENIKEPGAYIYNSNNNKLLLYKRFEPEDLINILNSINSDDNSRFLSNVFIAYAMDIDRATLKYQYRGYRHALIEIGLIIQEVKHSLIDLEKNYGEVTWSGFMDNSITYNLGLDIQKFPITMLQFIGVVSKGSD